MLNIGHGLQRVSWRNLDGDFNGKWAIWCDRCCCARRRRRVDPDSPDKLVWPCIDYRSALDAEALALRDGARLAVAGHFENVILETGYLALVILWKNRQHRRAEVKPILDEVQELSRVFVSFSCVFCSEIGKCCSPSLCKTNLGRQWSVCVVTSTGFLCNCLRDDCNPTINQWIKLWFTHTHPKHRTKVTKSTLLPLTDAVTDGITLTREFICADVRLPLFVYGNRHLSSCCQRRNSSE